MDFSTAGTVGKFWNDGGSAALPDRRVIGLFTSVVFPDVLRSAR